MSFSISNIDSLIDLTDRLIVKMTAELQKIDLEQKYEERNFALKNMQYIVSSHKRNKTVKIPPFSHFKREKTIIVDLLMVLATRSLQQIKTSFICPVTCS